MSAEKIKTKVTRRVAKPRSEEMKRVPVSESNIRKAATRLLNHNLVSTEVQYVQRVLGTTATQKDIDDNVIAVRKMVWSSIVVPD
ncbi:MAG TPA: hypothetical protein VF883_05050 [Thermoanaerobaculia bacterium]|jgi:hypothetical protein